MKIFEFHFQTNKLILVILFPIIYFLRQLCLTSLRKEKVKDNQFGSHPFFLSLIMFFSEIVSGILELITKCRAKNANLTKEFEEKSLKAKSNKKYILINTSFRKFIDVLSIFGIAAFDYAGYALIAICASLGKVQIQTDFSGTMRMTEIIFLSLFTTKILRYPIYRHHKVSLFIIFSGIFIIIIFDYLCIIINERETVGELTLKYFMNIVIFLTSYCCYSLKNIGAKWMMEKRYYSPFLLLFYVGLAGLLLTLITLSFTPFINCSLPFCSNDKVENIIKTLQIVFGNVKIALLLLCVLFGGVFINLFSFLINNYFNPCYIGIADSVSGFLLWIYSLINNANNENKDYYSLMITITAFSGIIFCFLFIGCLIYTEILILNCCRLRENINSEITKRADLDASVRHLSMNFLEDNSEDTSSE